MLIGTIWRWTVKIWRWSPLCVVLPGLFIVSYLNEIYAIDLARTFLNGETAVGFLVKHGWQFRTALSIAILISTYDTLYWFFALRSLAHCKKKFEEWLEAAEKRLEKFFGGNFPLVLSEFRTGFPWALKAYWATKTVLNWFAPRLTVPPPGTIICKKKILIGYCSLPFYGAFPGCIWKGVDLSISLGLNGALSRLLVCLGNSAKMVGAGYLAMHIGPWGVVAVVLSVNFVEKKFLKL